MFGIYVHIPFCLSKCPYCDFYSVPVKRSEIPHEEYLRAILAQLDRDAPYFEGSEVGTIYFGGGTPSLMPLGFFAAILDAISGRFPCGSLMEISCEANPATVDAAWFKGARDSGVTRVSIGVQSFQDRLLSILGRAHRADDARRAIACAQDAGFASVGVDLIFGICGERTSDLEEDVRTATAFQLQHVSAYQLTIEEGTPFAELYAPRLDDDLLEQMRLVASMLLRGGWARYEISNFARPGFECRHNLNYWGYGEYLGLGPAATSFRFTDHGFARRWAQPRDVRAYISCGGGEADEDSIDRRTAMAEFCFLGLRRTKGISLKDFEGMFCVSFEGQFGEAASRLQAEGLLEAAGDRIALTARGVELSNQVFQSFLP